MICRGSCGFDRWIIDDVAGAPLAWLAVLGRGLGARFPSRPLRWTGSIAFFGSASIARDLSERVESYRPTMV